MDLVKRLPPQSLEAELAVLGGMIIDNKAIPIVSKKLKVEDFYREAHRKIFTTMVGLNNDNIAVDLASLVEELKRKSQLLEEVGGAAYIAALPDATPTAANIDYYVAIVKEKAILRKVILRATELISVAHDGRDSLDEILARFQRYSADLTKESGDKETIEKLEAGDDLMGHFSLRETPFEGVNRALGGFFGGEFIIVGARPGIGKTSFVCNLLIHTGIEERRPVLYFGADGSAEGSKERFHRRLLSSISGVPFKDFGKTRLRGAQADEILAAQKQINAAPIHCLNSLKKLNVISLIAKARKKKEELGELGLVIVENLQELTWPEKFDNRKKEADNILSALNSLALEINTPVVLSCQISRKAEERDDARPTLGDLKETGAIEEKATKVLLLWWSRDLKSGRALREENCPESGELIIAKGGPAISLPLEFHGYCYSWREPSKC